MSEHKMTCEEIIALLTPYLDRELDEAEASTVRRHLESCSHCASYFSFESSMLKLVKSKLNECKMPAGLEKRIFDTLQED